MFKIERKNKTIMSILDRYYINVLFDTKEMAKSFVRKYLLLIPNSNVNDFEIIELKKE